MVITTAAPSSYGPRRAAQPTPPPPGPDPSSPADHVDPPSTPDFDKGEQLKRYLNNLGLHIGLSDGPTVIALLANYNMVPAAASPLVNKALPAINVLNVATSGLAVAADLREIRGTFRNPQATKLDKVMDITHLVGGDLTCAATGMMPFFMNMTGPVANGVFLTGQALGIGMDLIKTGYDFHRKGQQSAHH